VIFDAQSFGGGGSGASSDGFSWTDGQVMCLLATRAGPDRLITLFAVTADKRLIISSYPVHRYVNCLYFYYCVTEFLLCFLS